MKSNIPDCYKILRHSVDLKIPDFSQHEIVDFKTLCPEKIDTIMWFNLFAQRIEESIGREYLPICRMSDGEFRFLLGEQPPSKRLSLFKWSHNYLKYIRRKYFIKNNFNGISGSPDISVGDYTSLEWKQSMIKYENHLHAIAKKGILAIHLSYCDRPFQEHFFPKLKEKFDEIKIDMSINNYVPFYFVYALLTGEYRHRLFSNNRILLIHGATGEKKSKIISSVKKLGAKKVCWHSISQNRSLFDTVDISPYVNNIDLCLVGAGVGKVNIITQLHPLNVPCLDAGFVFEIWANSEAKWKRTFCVPDAEFDSSKVQFIPTQKLK